MQWQDGELGNVKDYPCLNMPNVYRTKPVFAYNATTPARVIIKGELIVCENAYFAVALSAEKSA